MLRNAAVWAEGDSYYSCLTKKLASISLGMMGTIGTDPSGENTLARDFTDCRDQVRPCAPPHSPSELCQQVVGEFPEN